MTSPKFAGNIDMWRGTNSQEAPKEVEHSVRTFGDHLSQSQRAGLVPSRSEAKHRFRSKVTSACRTSAGGALQALFSSILKSSICGSFPISTGTCNRFQGISTDNRKSSHLYCLPTCVMFAHVFVHNVAHLGNTVLVE